MIRLTTLDNRFESDLITEALEREGIDFVVKTFQDTAYDGLFVTQKGFGLLLVQEEDKSRAQALVDDIRSAVSQNDLFEDGDLTDNDPEENE